MPLPVSRAPQPHWLRGFLKVIDWRLVAAVGLPLWAFLTGVAVAHKPAPPAPAEVAEAPPASVAPATPQAPDDTIPAPREVVYRTEFQPVPIAIPVPTPAEPVAVAPAEEFKLPASEVLPADRCKTFDTKIRFHGGLPEAAEEAKNSKKMLLVLHISGNFDDPGFT